MPHRRLFGSLAPLTHPPRNVDGADKYNLFRMTYPIFIELLLAMLVGSLDQIMVAQYSELSVGALGNAGGVLNLLVLMFSIISLSTTVLVTQSIGAKRFDQIGRIYTLAVVVNCGFGLFISALLIGGAPTIGHFLGVPETMFTDFCDYLRIVGGTLFLQALFNTFSAILKSNAEMRVVMYLSLTMNVINLIGNALLIYGLGPFPEWGIRGAAVATVLSRLIALVLIILVYRKKIHVSLSLRQLRPFPKALLGGMLRIGVPAGGESISYNLTTMVIMIMINKFGEVSINARLYAGMFATITWTFSSSVSQAAQILIGYAVGEGNYAVAERQKKRTLILSVVVSLCIAVLLWLCSTPLFHIVTVNPETIALGKTILLLDVFVEFGRALNYVLVRSLQATGDAVFPIAIGICSTWVIAVGLSYLLGVRLGMGLPGIWIAMACDEIVRGLIFQVRWKTGIWRTKKVLSDTT